MTQPAPYSGEPPLAKGAIAPHSGEERTYQVVTVAAILAVLATVWIF